MKFLLFAIKSLAFVNENTIFADSSVLMFMSKTIKNLASALILILSFSMPALSQSKNSGGTVSGKVVSASDGSAVEFAVITFSPSKMYTTTDSQGNYSLSGIPAGDVTVSASFLGMENLSKETKVASGKSSVVDFSLTEVSFRMDEVTVTATRGEAGQATSSKISRQAMDHLQASSLNDVMSLLPGVAVSNSGLSSAQSLTLRGNVNGSASTSLSMNSLGTSVIVDGAPVSNNANLQILSPAISSSNLNAIGGASPNTGVDIRSISTDNVESVEVIRGIASVQYGDMTSGAVIVKSQAGASPFIIRLRTNPNIWQVSASKGFQTEKHGSFNVSGDYAYNTDKLTASYLYYQRMNTKLLWSKSFKELNTNTSLEFNYSKDTQDYNPDMAASDIAQGAENIGGRLSTNGHLNIKNAGWLKSLDYNIAGSYTDKKSFYETTASNAMSLYSTAMSNSIVGNIPGGEIYDENGKAITSWSSGDEKASATVMPYSYFSHYDIYGKEINAYAKITANFFAQFGHNLHNGIVTGADFKTDGNVGKGLVFPEGTPPLRSIGNASSGFRSRKYSDIPFINQFGLFAEDNLVWNAGDRDVSLVAGLRYDRINGKQVLEPRTNVSVEIIPDVFDIRGGWGISAKAPTALYLYPQNAYYDALLYSNMHSGLTADEEVVVSKTTVFDTSNPDLQIATNRKAEIGFDLTIAKRYKLSVTAYDERMNNGYSYSSDFSCWHLVPVTQYVVASKNTGEKPVLKEGSTYNKFFSYNKPLNNSVNHSQGVEFELDFGRIEAIRTAFYMNGAYTYSGSSNKGEAFSSRENTLTPGVYNIGVYEPNLVTYMGESFLTTFRAVHNIPKLGFVISLTAQVSWFDKVWSKYGDDEMFIGYLSWKDGQYYDFDPAKKDDPEFAYMFPPLSSTRKTAEKTQPYLMMNINISKEIGDWLTASFYVNNLLNSRPKYESKKSPGQYQELGIPIFFGFELKMTVL